MPLGALGLDVWLPDWSTSVINRKPNQSVNKIWIVSNRTARVVSSFSDAVGCWAMLFLVAPFSIKSVPYGFVITPQIQVFTYLMETATQFRALNKWQQHPQTTEETKTTTNKHRAVDGRFYLAPGDVLPVQGDMLNRHSSLMTRVTCAHRMCRPACLYCYWPIRIWTYEDDLISGKNALVLSAYV